MVFLFAGSTEDVNIPTLVQALNAYKITDVACGGGEAHTLAVENNGSCMCMCTWVTQY